MSLLEIGDLLPTSAGTDNGPPLPDASVLRPEGVVVSVPGEPVRWVDFVDGASRVVASGDGPVGGLALDRGHAAVASWDQTVRVTTLADGASWQHKAIRKADLGGDYLPPFVLTEGG